MEDDLYQLAVASVGILFIFSTNMCEKGHSLPPTTPIYIHQLFKRNYTPFFSLLLQRGLPKDVDSLGTDEA